MPIGSDPELHFDKGPAGLLERVAFSIMSIIGAALAGAGASAAGFVQRLRNQSLDNSRNTPLPPELVAAAVLKGHVDEGAGAAEAAFAGVDAQRFKVMVDTAGNPPGPETLLDLWRRGKIDAGRLVTGLREGFLRNDWIDVYEARRFDPLSAIEYLQAAVQGHLDEGQAIERAGERGVDPDDARLLYETLGVPPGVMEMLRLWKRGVISEDEARQVIRESHYKNKYTDAILALADYYPPPRTITTLLSHGAISEADAQRYFQAAGLSPQLAQAYVASALHAKTASHKELGVSTVRTLYADHMLSRDDALADLAKLGYGGQEANLLLDLSAAQARQKLRTQAINRVRSVFVAGKIDASTARADLGTIGVDADQVEELLKLWAIEQTTPSRVLTIGQLNQAVKKGIITEAEFMDRAVKLGYVESDARILYEIDAGGPPATTGG